MEMFAENWTVLQYRHGHGPPNVPLLLVPYFFRFVESHLFVSAPSSLLFCKMDGDEPGAAHSMKTDSHLSVYAVEKLAKSAGSSTDDIR